MDLELRDALLRLIWKKFAGYPNVSSLAEDIVQEGYLRLRRSPGYTPEKENFYYLSTVCMRLACRYFMAQAADFSRLYLDAGGEPLVEEEDIAKELLSAEDTAAILRSLQTLREIERIVITQRYYGSFSFAQIAEANGLKLSTVLSHHRRALAKLRPQLTKFLAYEE